MFVKQRVFHGLISVRTKRGLERDQYIYALRRGQDRGGVNTGVTLERTNRVQWGLRVTEAGRLTFYVLPLFRYVLLLLTLG